MRRWWCSSGDGSVQTKCVSFAEPAISGEELLTRSGMTVVLNPNGGFGGAVCSINGYGCAYPTQDCFCKCQGVQCEYWAYYHWTGGAWQYSQVGATGYQVKNGALEGWSWGQGNFSSGTIPPTVKFEDICTSPTATPTATPPIRIPTPWPTKQVGLVIGLPNGQEHLEIVTVPMTATTFDVLQAAKIVLLSQIHLLWTGGVQHQRHWLPGDQLLLRSGALLGLLSPERGQPDVDRGDGKRRRIRAAGWRGGGSRLERV